MPATVPRWPRQRSTGRRTCGSGVSKADHASTSAIETSSPAVPSPEAQPPRRGGLPRKGMLAQELDAKLGPPTSSKERKEGMLRVQTKEYSTPEGRVTGEFVEGVLIRYTITSE